MTSSNDAHNQAIMCELFAMTSAADTTVRYELTAFAAEGGESHVNRDGWGIMFAEDRDAHIFREAAPADASMLARMILEREIPCRHLMAHVRRASHGEAVLANTHPFTRVRQGHTHHFAHNGTLHAIESLREAEVLRDHRVGDTDSELAFLLLLERLQHVALEDQPGRFAIFARFAAEMRELGSANFLFYDGLTLFVHADRRVFETETGLSAPREPGLVTRHFGNHTAPCSWHGCGPKLEHVNPETILFASVPLDDEEWQPLPRGTAMALRNGRILHQHPA